MDSKILDTFFKIMNPYLRSQKDRRVTAVVPKARYHRITKNQTQQRHEHSVGIVPVKAVVKVLLYSVFDGDVMFHKNPLLDESGANFLVYIKSELLH